MESDGTRVHCPESTRGILFHQSPHRWASSIGQGDEKRRKRRPGAEYPDVRGPAVEAFGSLTGDVPLLYCPLVLLGYPRVRWPEQSPELPALAHIAVIIHDGTPGAILNMTQGIIGDDQDDAQPWVAILACGHPQHLRHQLPWTDRPWVLTATGRERCLGSRLDCPLCDQAPRPDQQG
jgi:hypothetical protein